MNDSDHPLRGVLCGIAGAVSWGVSGTCSQFLCLYYEVSSIWLTAFRMVTAGAVLLVICFLAEKKKAAGILRSPADVRNLLIFAVFGLILNQLSYLSAIRYSNAGTATVLQSISIVLIAVITTLAARHLPGRAQITAIVLVLTGVFLISTQGDVHTLSITPKGLFSGLTSAGGVVSYSFLSIPLIEKWNSRLVTGYGMLIGGIIFTIATRSFYIPALDLRGWAFIAGVVLLGAVLGYTLFLKCIHDLGALDGNLLAPIEPVTATILTAAFLHTKFTVPDLLGFASILGAVVLINMADRKKAKRVVSETHFPQKLS